jgi:hypothetical protein
MGGLFVATFLTILYLPALYALWFRRRLGEREPEPATDKQYALPGILGVSAE